MSEQEPVDFKRGRPPEEFPASTFPTVFSDGVISFVPTVPIVKFYLGRIDPNMFGRGGAVMNPFAQVIMPTLAFVDTAAFLQQQVRRMVREKMITQEQVDQAAAAYPDTPLSEGSNA
jgi:hypothetical protein